MNKPIQNIFADLDLPNPEELQAISSLSIKISKAIKERELSPQNAASILGCTVDQLKQIANEPFDFTLAELCRYLLCLGMDVDIAVRPSKETEAHLCVVE